MCQGRGRHARYNLHSFFDLLFAFRFIFEHSVLTFARPPPFSGSHHGVQCEGTFARLIHERQVSNIPDFERVVEAQTNISLVEKKESLIKSERSLKPQSGAPRPPAMVATTPRSSPQSHSEGDARGQGSGSTHVSLRSKIYGASASLATVRSCLRTSRSVSKRSPTPPRCAHKRHADVRDLTNLKNGWRTAVRTLFENFPSCIVRNICNAHWRC